MFNTDASDTPIGIVGAGAMGAGIAEVAATAGHPVSVVDLGQDALRRGRELVAASLAAGVRRGSLGESAAAAILGRIAWAESLDAIGNAQLVIEAIAEKKEAKRDLFTGLESVLKPYAVIASNTSSLPIAELAQGFSRPRRFLGLHFFNPAPAMRLVEIIPGPNSEPELVADLRRLMSIWGKSPVIVRDVPGFIVNRVARPYYAEGFLAMEEGAAAADVDLALKQGGGFRMGPLELADLIGHDVNYGVAESIFAAYAGRTRFRPQNTQKALVEAGRLGRKSGGGVYRAGSATSPALLAPAPAPRVIAWHPGPKSRAMGASGREDKSLPEDTVSLDGILLAFADGRSARRRAEEDERITILLDATRNETSPLMIATLAPDAPAEAAGKLAGLAFALGRQALILPDRPGGLVLRSLAQLANAAADALRDGVACAEDIDAALVFGANHPEGPLAWARRVGFSFVRQTLDHIARETGDSLYTPSQGFAA